MDRRRRIGEDAGACADRHGRNDRAGDLVVGESLMADLLLTFGVLAILLCFAVVVVEGGDTLRMWWRK